MLQRDGPDNVQSQAVAAIVRPVGKAPLKHMGQVLGGDARARVPHRNDPEALLLGQLQRDRPIRRGKEESVVAKIFQDNAQLILPALDQDILFGQIEPEGQAGELHIRKVGAVKIVQKLV